MFCRNCGKELENDWKVCPYCNAVVLEEETLNHVVSEGEREAREQPRWKKIIKRIVVVLLILIYAIYPFTIEKIGMPKDYWIDLIVAYLLISIVFVCPYLLIINYKGVREKLPLYKKHRWSSTIFASIITYLIIGLCGCTIVDISKIFHTEQYWQELKEGSFYDIAGESSVKKGEEDIESRDLSEVDMEKYVGASRNEIVKQSGFKLDKEKKCAVAGDTKIGFGNDEKVNYIIIMGDAKTAPSFHGVRIGMKKDDALKKLVDTYAVLKDIGDNESGSIRIETKEQVSCKYVNDKVTSIQYSILSEEELALYQEHFDESEYIFPYSDSREISADEIAALSDEDIRLAINEIYARRGMLFENEDLQKYFNDKSWYKGRIPDAKFDETVFNTIEKTNINKLNSSLSTTIKTNGEENAAGYAMYDFDATVSNPGKYIGKRIWFQGKVDYSYVGMFLMSYMEGVDTVLTVNYDEKKITEMPKEAIYDAVTIVYGTIIEVDSEMGATISLDCMCISSHDIYFPEETGDYIRVTSANDVMKVYDDDSYFSHFIVEGTFRETTTEEYNEAYYEHESNPDAVIELESGEKIYLKLSFHEFAENFVYANVTKQSMEGKRVRLFGFSHTYEYQDFPYLGIEYMEPLE